MSKTRSFLALYWVYGVIGASLAGCFATLWLDASSVAVRNGFFWHFALVLPAVLFLYARQHGQGWLVLVGRVIATLALAPSLLAGTVGLPEWTQSVLTEPVRVALRIAGIIILLLSEASAFVIALRIWWQARELPEAELTKQIAERSGIPLPIARIMAFELGLWRRLFRGKAPPRR